MYYEIVVGIAAAFFYEFHQSLLVAILRKKLFDRIRSNLHSMLRLFMLICQNEFNLCAILSEIYGGIFDEIRGLKNDIEVCPVHP